VLFRYVIDDDINTATAAELKIVLFGLFGKDGAGTQEAQEAQKKDAFFVPLVLLVFLPL
jgi:hypothetical protein